MVNKLVGWMGIKNTLMASRYSKELNFNKNDTLLATFLQAISYYSRILTNCNIQSITYLEKGNSFNGLSFRISRHNEDLLSIVVDEVDSENDDFLFFEDMRSSDLMNAFYDENAHIINTRCFDVKPLREATLKGNFGSLYEGLENKGVMGKKKV